jgi:hypothetical protein
MIADNVTDHIILHDFLFTDARDALRRTVAGRRGMHSDSDLGLRIHTEAHSLDNTILYQLLRDGTKIIVASIPHAI